MILAQQTILGGVRQLTPEFVQSNFTQYASSSTYNFTITNAPVEGNLMVLCIGGSQNRTPNFPGGWNVVNMAGAGETLNSAWKIAGAGETQAITITFSANLQGQITYHEFRHIDVTNPVISTLSGVGNPFAAVTSKSHSTYDVTVPSVVIQQIGFTTAPTWTADNGFIGYLGVDRAKAAYRIYSNPATGEITTWSGGSATGSVGMIAFRGRLI